MNDLDLNEALLPPTFESLASCSVLSSTSLSLFPLSQANILARNISLSAPIELP